MVHALHEARRVLKPNGLLLDLRPAAVHRRVGLFRAGRTQWLGAMRESFDDDYAANRAVAEVVAEGRFKKGKRIRFECSRMMDSLAEFRAFIEEFAAFGNLPSHEWLVKRLRRAISAETGRVQIVIQAPLNLRVLAKAGVQS